MQALKPLSRRRFALQLAALSSAFLTSQPFAQNPVSASKVASAMKIPDELSAVDAALSNWRLQGKGMLRFFGFKAYDAFLWVNSVGAGAGSTNTNASPLVSKSLFALEIVYNTSLTSQEIVNVSILEMTRLRRFTDGQRKAWADEMMKTFPSVKSGDRFTGVFNPKSGTQFFFNGKLISEIKGAAFGDAFFAIWLDERAKKPELRRELLGLPDKPTPPPIEDKIAQK